jgi:hypothetical protein
MSKAKKKMRVNQPKTLKCKKKSLLRRSSPKTRN